MASLTKSRPTLRSTTRSLACVLRLPDPCLLAVMQCADGAADMLTAAKAHSRLQQAAVEALSSITAEELDQARVDSLLLYLAKYGQHVRSLDLSAPSANSVQLRELPPSLTKLDSLQLTDMTLQLQPGLGGTQGVLGAGLPLTRLVLSGCTLLDGAQGLPAALAQLPDLQHLSVDTHAVQAPAREGFPTDVLSHLVQLTCLLLKDNMCCQNSSSSSSSSNDDDPSAILQPLQALTRLADLQLWTISEVTADMLSGAGQLTRLVLEQETFEPRALAGKSQLQQLTLADCSFVPGADVAQLMSELQHLTQLTRLDLGSSCMSVGGPSTPPAAFASLTASSQLQHLDYSDNTLPSAAWQYLCPPGRTLPQLQYLDISGFREADGSPSLPNTSAIVRCCPGLQYLFTSMPCSTAQLAALQRLTGLHTLAAGAGDGDDCEGVQALCQLTGLQELELTVASLAEARLLQLTQLTQLTALSGAFGLETLYCDPQMPVYPPVWHQVLDLLSYANDPEVAQQAADALSQYETKQTDLAWFQPSL